MNIRTHAGRVLFTVLLICLSLSGRSWGQPILPPPPPGFPDDFGFENSSHHTDSLVVPDPPGGGTGTNGGGATFNSAQFTTNDLWLEVSGIATSENNTTTQLTIHPPWNGTNIAYDLFATTNVHPHDWQWILRTTSGQTNVIITNDISFPQMFFVLGLTNDTDGDGLTDAFELLVSHSSTTNIDTLGNGLPDGWQWAYFGNLSQTAAGDYDGDGVNNGLEYTNGTDPNKIAFSLIASNRFVGTNSLPLQLGLVRGVPSSMALLINDTNFLSANWQFYPGSNVSVALGTNDGTYNVWVGLRGRLTNSQQTWAGVSATRDTVPPVITLTNPTIAAVTKPIIQLQGYVSETLATFAYDLSNSAGLLANQPVYITGQWADTNSIAITTNYFQAYDVPLAPGTNWVFLHATDLAGNTTTTNFDFILDYSGVTNAPAITVTYPLTNSLIASSNFTLLGRLDDDTATLTVSNTDGSQIISALVERGGKFSADLALPQTTNIFTLLATNAAGNSITQSLTVIRSALTVTVDLLSSDQLAQSTVTISGTISDSNKTVWVNGTAATMSGNTWSITISNPGGNELQALIQAGSSLSSPQGDLTIDEPLPPTIQVVSFTETNTTQFHISRPSIPNSDESELETTTRVWNLGLGGSSRLSSIETFNGSCSSFTPWPTNWPDGATLDGTDSCRGAITEETPADWRNTDYQTMETGISYDGPNAWPYEYQNSYSAQTVLELATGGLAEMGAQKLIRLVATATRYDASGATSVNGSQIQLLGQTLAPTATNANVGELYVVAQAGSKQNLPSKVIETNGSRLTNNAINVRSEEVKLQSLTIVSNSAMQIDGTNWAAIKTTNASDYVIVEATLSDTNTLVLDAAQKAIKWNGGDAVPGHVLQRRISKTNSVETMISASLGATNLSLNVWILWGSISYNFSGNFDASDNLSFTNFAGLTFPDARLAGTYIGQVSPPIEASVTKVEIIGVLTPPGIGNLITNGFSINPQKVEYYSWSSTGDISGTVLSNVTSSTPGTHHGPASDTPLPQRIVPVNDKIFAIDAPGVLEVPSVSGYEAIAANFVNYIYFNGIIISVPNTWHTHVRTTFAASSNPTSAPCAASSGNPALPITWGDSNW